MPPSRRAHASAPVDKYFPSDSLVIGESSFSAFLISSATHINFIFLYTSTHRTQRQRNSARKGISTNNSHRRRSHNLPPRHLPHRNLQGHTQWRPLPPQRPQRRKRRDNHHGNQRRIRGVWVQMSVIAFTFATLATQSCNTG